MNLEFLVCRELASCLSAEEYIGIARRVADIVILGTEPDFADSARFLNEENVLKSNKISELRKLTNGAVHS